MNEVQVGRFSQLLHKLLDMGEGSPTPNLAPELFAMLGLEVDRPEWEFLRGGKLCQGYVEEAAGVGLKSAAALRNPTGSGVLAVVTGVMALANADYIVLSQNLGNGTDLAAFDNDGVERVCDFRAGVNDLGYSMLPTCQILSDTTVQKGGAFRRLWPWATGSSSLRHFEDHTPFILPPNTAIIVTGQSDNTAIGVSFTWTERVIGKMELQGVNPRIS